MLSYSMMAIGLTICEQGKSSSEDSIQPLGNLYMQYEMELVTNLLFYYNSVLKEKCFA